MYLLTSLSKCLYLNDNFFIADLILVIADKIIFKFQKILRIKKYKKNSNALNPSGANRQGENQSINFN